MLGLTAAAASVAANTALAAEWTIAPSVQLTTQAQHNPRLVPEGGDTEDSTGAVAAFEVQRRTERLELVANSKVGYQRYQQDTELDRSDQHLDVALHWQGELVTWSGSAVATRDTTLTSELGTTGLTQFNQRHEGFDFSLAPSWLLSERLSMGSSLGWQVNRYPDPANGLSDYHYGTMAVNASYVVSDRASLSLVGSAGRFSSGNSRPETNNASVRLQAQYAWSPLWSISAGAGPSWVEENQKRERGVVYNVSIGRRLEFSSLSLSASRSQSPSGFGVLTELDDASLDFSTQISERLTGSLSVGLVRRRDAIPAFRLDLQEVRYRRTNASLGWHINPNWLVALGVGNKVQRLGTLSETSTAQNYEAGLTLTWSGNPHVY